MTRSLNNLVKKYRNDLFNSYIDFSKCVHELISMLLKKNRILHHSVTWRAKTPEKLREKIYREGKLYKDPLNEITDLAGVRIITYFTSDVDKILPLIENEFEIDRENSVDKRVYDDPSWFGYKSFHYVLSLSSERCKLTEYSAYKGMRCEVQIRTILQHAWAEIEHDIIYKTEKDVPFVLKREFACLAGVLELADRDFESLRRRKIKEVDVIKKLINGKKYDLPIEMESLRYYLVKVHHEKIEFPVRLSKLIKFLRANNILTIQQFHNFLSSTILSEADQVCEKIECPSINDTKKCLLRYFLGVGNVLKLTWCDIEKGTYCPRLPHTI